MKAVFLTAGAGGMYCGSCMHDNALARAMRQSGVDCLLQPLYTPIRTDSQSMADNGVFYGGVHIYLLQQLPWLRFVPATARRWLDWTPLLRWATRRTHTADAAMLGQLTLSMLRGTEGRQAAEASRLVDWLAGEISPDAIVLSNLLIGGALPEIRKRLPQARIVVLLQGDDIFLDHLPDPLRGQAIEQLRKLVEQVDRFVVNSRFYADKMGALLQIPDHKIVLAPLSIDTAPFEAGSAVGNRGGNDEFRLGYLARIAPEKGLHRLADAFVELARAGAHDDLTLHVAGWLGEANQEYLDTVKETLDRAGLTTRFTYHGSPDLEGKIAYLRSIDLLCVPTDYEEPKGLFVLESLAAGVPVVQPDHGAFGELIESTGGGVVVPPGRTEELCRAIERLKSDPALRNSLALQGAASVQKKHTIQSAAEQMKTILFE